MPPSTLYTVPPLPLLYTVTVWAPQATYSPVVMECVLFRVTAKLFLLAWAGLWGTLQGSVWLSVSFYGILDCSGEMLERCSRAVSKANGSFYCFYCNKRRPYVQHLTLTNQCLLCIWWGSWFSNFLLSLIIIIKHLSYKTCLTTKNSHAASASHKKDRMDTTGREYECKLRQTMKPTW